MSAVAAALALGASAVVVNTTVAGSETAPGRYIVVLHEGVSAPGAVAQDHDARFGARVGAVYRHALSGYVATLGAGAAARLADDPRVAYVEADQPVQATAQVLPWGVDRVGADTSSTLAGNGSGTVTGVTVYVIDTGIDTAHVDLNDVGHVNFAGGKNKDCHGHGTHVAGTAGARDNTSDVVGVAPGVRLVGVKVLGCNGSGWTSNVIKGVDWVTANAVAPAVANMSLGGGPSTALDAAITRSVSEKGVVYAVAAGNSAADACAGSPARTGTTEGVITVAATDSADQEASFSNYGACVDVWAPGVSILSTRMNGGTSTKSGTSMAAPHVAGAAALYRRSHTADAPAAVETAVVGAATATSNTSKDGAAISVLWAGGF